MTSAPKDCLLSAEGLTKTFYKGQGFAKDKIVAVNEASFTISSEEPEIFVLAGESGSGKSTIANMILGFYPPTKGKLSFKGTDITEYSSRSERKKIMSQLQPILQDPFETFNPLKIASTYLTETKRNFSDLVSDQYEIEEALELVGLELGQIKNKFPSELSGGQAQRVSIARALIPNPSLLIADEPVSMVDASLRMSVVNLFKELKDREELSIFYITHDLAVAYYLGNKIGIMLRGEIVEQGEVEKVLDDPVHPYTKLLLESSPKPDPKKRWKEDIDLGDTEVQQYLSEGCKFADRCPHAGGICKEERPEEVFVQGRAVKCHSQQIDRIV